MEFRKLNYCRQSLDKLKAEHDVKCGKRGHSAYSRGVLEYAEELLDSLFECAEYDGEEPCNEKLLRKAMLNGAENWHQYSWGGCSLIYDADIAERLCTPSQLRKTRNAEWKLRSDLEWLDFQAQALARASIIVRREFRDALKAEREEEEDEYKIEE